MRQARPFGPEHRVSMVKGKPDAELPGHRSPATQATPAPTSPATLRPAGNQAGAQSSGWLDPTHVRRKQSVHVGVYDLWL